MNEKYKKTCEYLNYVEHLLILASTVTGCISISAFPYKSIIKKKKKKYHKIVLLAKSKLNSIEVLIFKILLAGDKLIPKLHLKQPGFTQSVCGPFTKHCARIQNFREIGNLKHLCRNELDKAYFAHDVAYSDRADLAKRTISDKFLKDRAKNHKYDGYQRALANMIYKFFYKKTGLGLSVNELLAEKLHKQ